ncbi:MAG: DUF4231 domain-containing protein [Patescibacteria group bacterium]|nr:DUF4231 domain-containing protein [Patescibacteria group bacterium]
MSDISEYMKNRVEGQINWYEKKANHNKKSFHICQIIIIITSIIIPVINIIDFATFEIRITSSILGGIIVGLTGLIQLKKYQDNWILFRTNEEILKKEKFLYINQAGGYSNQKQEERDKLFVERIESIISSETSKFFTMHSQKPTTTSKEQKQD